MILYNNITMAKEFEYDLRWALLTSVVLILASILIFSINSKDYLNPAWENFSLVVIPSLLILSFAPIGVTKIINRKQNDH